ncbi:hypothetical protein [Enterovirga aerilata]|uniref:Uncharacterized protein n=1 Tax=Enterovirga aerilata TaxID=2730920 RepID=A0A849I9T7_9HYPH|nr:hypothetical protein [Enterovirga sp. DB1703]NNM73035.1 hypothetical protein [Enterovirga sp. DB1703]
MSSKLKLAGMAAGFAATMAGIGLIGAGESTPAAAAPAAAAYAAPPQARPVESPPAVVTQEAAARPAVDCARQAWPYVARECLAAADGTPVRKVSRTITASGR